METQKGHFKISLQMTRTVGCKTKKEMRLHNRTTAFPKSLTCSLARQQRRCYPTNSILSRLNQKQKESALFKTRKFAKQLLLKHVILTRWKVSQPLENLKKVYFSQLSVEDIF